MTPIALPLALGLILSPIGNGTEGTSGYWDWQLTHPYDLSLDVRIMALDGEEHSKETIAALKARGIKTICYISVGTVEDFRSDKDRFPDHVLGKAPGNWPGELYLDIRQMPVIMPIMLDRMEACKARGFDAIEPDNMDGFENDTGFDITKEDTVKYLSLLSEFAHGLGLEILQKNAPELVPALVDKMDFMLVEDCFRYDFCWDIKPYVAAGKDVLAVEYTDSNLDWPSICDEARDLGFKLLLKDREVTAGGRVCREE